MNVLLFILLIVVILIALAGFYLVLAIGSYYAKKANLTEKMTEAQAIVNDRERGMRATK
jgi:cell division protein FtsI/penicillin-binding protein 2